MTEISDIDSEEMIEALNELESVFEGLAKTGKSLEESLSSYAGAVERMSEDGGSLFSSFDRFGEQLAASIHGSGRALYSGNFGDMGKSILRKLTGEIGDEVAGFVSSALGGGLAGNILGGIAGELVRGIEGLFEGTKKTRLPEVNLEEIFNPPTMLTAPGFALPSSAFFSGRYPGTDSPGAGRGTSAEVNVTVNGVVGAPRDVADEIGRIVTRTLADLNRRGA